MSLRDEMEAEMYEAFDGDIARPNLKHVSDALMPLVERAVKDAAIEAMAHGALFGSSSTGKIESIVARVVGRE